MAIKLVIDTNVLVSSLSRHSSYHWLILRLLNADFDIHVTTEIILEYEEVLKIKYSENVANNFITALKELPNVHFTHIYYKWNLLKDKDDNKFVDCYVAANADYLLTHDTGFKILRSISFPIIQIISLNEFERIIEPLSNE